MINPLRLGPVVCVTINFFRGSPRYPYSYPCLCFNVSSIPQSINIISFKTFSHKELVDSLKYIVLVECCHLLFSKISPVVVVKINELYLCSLILRYVLILWSLQLQYSNYKYWKLRKFQNLFFYAFSPSRRPLTRLKIKMLEINKKQKQKYDVNSLLENGWTSPSLWLMSGEDLYSHSQKVNVLI